MKSRCVSAGDPMVPAGEQGDDYQTHYLDPCEVDEGTAEAEAWMPTEAVDNTHVQEMQNMMSFALRVLEFCFHCLDSSPWPFLLSEVLENYALAVEAPSAFIWHRAAGRQLSPSTQSGPALLDDGVAFAAPPSLALSPDAEAALGAMPATRLVLLRLQVRWTRGLEMEADFWKQKLSPDPAVNDRLERLSLWLEDGEVTWYLPGDDPCAFLRDARGRMSKAVQGLPGPRILNVGSGPLAPGPLECDVEAADGSMQRRRLRVVAADGLARFYNRILDEYMLEPPYMPQQCPVEELHTCFPPGHFDVVHMRNALDHVFDPLLGIQRMLQVVRPGGWVLLRHARNEGIPGHFRNGLHQWAFDTLECPDSKAMSAAGTCTPSFLLWNPELRLDVSSYLLGNGLASEVNTRLVDHPSDDAPEDEKYVWVDIRKPTDAEAGRYLTELSTSLVGQ